MNNQLTDEMFHEALGAEDELGSVIRVHLHVEYYIDEILSKLVYDTDYLPPLKLDYSDKVNLICALGVNPKFKTVLIALGSMRNKFAHKPFHKINKSEVNNLYKTLSSTDKEIFQSKYKKLIESHNTKPYKELDPKDKFILIAIIVRRIVITINDDLTSSQIPVGNAY